MTDETPLTDFCCFSAIIVLLLPLAAEADFRWLRPVLLLIVLGTSGIFAGAL